MDESRENYVLPVYGANAGCDEGQVADAREALEGASVLLVQQEIPLWVTAAAMEAARAAGATVILDPAPARELPDGFVEAADVVAPNRIEAEALTGVRVSDVESAAEAASALRARGVRVAIVKLGGAGCYVDSAEMTGHVPAFEVEPVATVAAGDAFAGGLAVGIAEGMELRDAVQLATAAGALCVTKPGAQDSMPTREEADRLVDTRA
jgi:ribokinase